MIAGVLKTTIIHEVGHFVALTLNDRLFGSGECIEISIVKVEHNDELKYHGKTKGEIDIDEKDEEKNIKLFSQRCIGLIYGCIFQCIYLNNIPTDEGIWVGTNASIVTTGTEELEGSYFELNSNVGGSGYVETLPLDFANFESIRLEFSYVANNFSSSATEVDNFIVSISCDNEPFQQVGDDFVMSNLQEGILGQFEFNQAINYACVYLNGASLSNNCQIRIEFFDVGDDSQLYVDDITITGCVCDEEVGCCGGDFAFEIPDVNNISALSGNISDEQYIRITNDLTIDVDYSFNDQVIYLAENVEITVNPDVQFDLNNCTLQGCEYLWRGINVQDGGRILIDDSTIRDAHVGVNMEYPQGTPGYPPFFPPIDVNSSEYKITETNFEDNVIGFQVFEDVSSASPETYQVGGLSPPILMVVLL